MGDELQDELEVTLGFVEHVNVSISPRPLNEWESRVIERLLSTRFAGWGLWRAQLPYIRVVRTCSDCPSSEFSVDPGAPRILEPTGRPAVGVAPASIEGVDEDGTEYEVLLHVRAGLITELDVYRTDSRGFVVWPAAESGHVHDISERVRMAPS